MSIPAIYGMSRLSYQDGEMLDAVDFTCEQDYVVELVRLHTQALFTAGVAAGLALADAAFDGKAGWTVQLGPGLALDDLGHHVAITRSLTLQLPRLSAIQPPPPGGPAVALHDDVPAAMTLWLAYRIQPAQPIGTGTEVRLRTIEDPLPYITTQVTVSGATSTVAVDLTTGVELQQVPGSKLSVQLALLSFSPSSGLTIDTGKQPHAVPRAAPPGSAPPPDPQAYASGTAQLAGGRAQVAIGEWAALRPALANAVPRVWPYVDATTAPASGAVVSQLVATRIADDGTFQVVALDTVNPQQTFAWELLLGQS